MVYGSKASMEIWGYPHNATPEIRPYRGILDHRHPLSKAGYWGHISWLGFGGGYPAPFNSHDVKVPVLDSEIAKILHVCFFHLQGYGSQEEKIPWFFRDRFHWQWCINLLWKSRYFLKICSFKMQFVDLLIMDMLDCFQRKRCVKHFQFGQNFPGKLTSRPWKLMGLEDDPFLLGPGSFPIVNFYFMVLWLSKPAEQQLERFWAGVSRFPPSTMHYSFRKIPQNGSFSEPCVSFRGDV